MGTLSIPGRILLVVCAYVAWKLGKEMAYEEVREAFGLELEQDDFLNNQREAAPNQ